MPDYDPDNLTGHPGIFGLPYTQDDARLILHPVPFDAFASGARGTADGPNTILNASSELDLYDTQFGEPHRAGIFMHEPDRELRQLSNRAGKLARAIRAGATPHPDPLDAGATIEAHTHARFTETLSAGKFPGLIGGDHSTPFGAIQACTEHAGTLGILQFDAHMDLRDAYEGFRSSHASIMRNVIDRLPAITSLVQIGLRDVSRGEVDFAAQHPDRIHPHFATDWLNDLNTGVFADRVRAAIEPLPESIYISFDIDAFEPHLCPRTGTPVPGGLSFNDACRAFGVIAESGRRVIGFDLVETGTGAIDGNVGARVLYKLCAVTLATNP